VTRHLLLFLDQELDLPVGVTILGRSRDCHLTIEDRLVSRHHARIVIDDEGTRVEDTGSRNGVRVDGVVIKGPTALEDGMLVRVGTQDFLFCTREASEQGVSRSTGRITGDIRFCADCRFAYPREAPECPNCGATKQIGEDTVTRMDGEVQASRDWSVRLFVETLDRAVSLGRTEEFGRILQRAATEIEEMLGARALVDAEGLTALSAHAVEASLATGDPAWALWVLDVHRRAGLIPAPDLVARMGKLEPERKPVKAAPGRHGAEGRARQSSHDWS
jgi:hypothetical protein